MQNLSANVLDFGRGDDVLFVGEFVLDERGMVALDNCPNFMVFEQEVVVGNIGDDVASDDVCSLAATGADGFSADSENHCGGVNDMVDECWGHGFGGLGYIQAVTSCVHHASPWILVNVICPLVSHPTA